MIKKYFFMILFSILIITPGFSNTIIEGKADIIDGDTLIINNHKIRLLCIDTPESNYYNKYQKCNDNKTNCGELAKLKLQALIDNNITKCTIYNKDFYGRDLGICKNIHGKFSYNERLLKSGYAYYYPCTQHPEWKDLNLNAKKNKLGLFNEELKGFINPKIWRKNNKKSK